jgi:hypothetical protein
VLVVGSQESFEKLIKGELYEQAAQRDIAGRSKMNRDQLLRAVRKAAS